jgi:molybdopterin molybdotransferase
MKSNSLHVLCPDEARRLMLEFAKPLGARKVKLRECLGLVLAQEVIPSINHPPFDNSGMDGYALIAADLAGATKETPKTLRVLETIPAGSLPSVEVFSGCASKIMTGAPMPVGADAVVRVEDTRPKKGRVLIFKEAKSGQDIRKMGEGLLRGVAVLASGRQLTPAHIGLAAASGLPELLVYPRPKVGIIVTGSEIVEPGTVLAPGKIYNSNGYMLFNQVLEAGGIPVDYGVAPDDLPSLKKMVRSALDECDIVLTTGGVSMGDYDFVQQAVADLGATIHFTQVSQHPGKAFVGGVADEALFFGLSGSPASVMVCFEIYVRPAIRKILGRKQWLPKTCVGSFTEPVKKKPGMTYWSRVIVERRDGSCRLHPSAPRHSGALRSMALGDGLAELPAELDVVPPGMELTVHLF